MENLAAQNSQVGLIKQPVQPPTIPTKQTSRSIENGTQVKFYFDRLLLLDNLLMMLAAVSIFITILYYDADYSMNPMATHLLYALCVLLVLSVGITYYRYEARIHLLISQLEVSRYEQLWSSTRKSSMLMEMGLLLLQPYPFLNDVTITTRNMYDSYDFQFKINYILVLLGFAKILIVVKVLLHRTSYMSPRASRNCRMYGCKASYIFAIKCLFKDSPMFLMSIVFFVSIVVFALGLRIAQRNLNVEHPKHFNTRNPQDLEDMGNSIWLTIITMTTVGYGDYFPRTLIGRIIDFVLVIWGIFIVSLMVVVLTNALDMDSNQSRALIVLNRLQAKRVVKEKAANLISTTFKRHRLQKKMAKQHDQTAKKQLKKKLRSVNIKLNNYSKEFQQVNRHIRSMYQLDNVYEEMTRQFEFINDQIGYLTDNQSETIRTLQDYLEMGNNEHIKQHHA